MPKFNVLGTLHTNTNVFTIMNVSLYKTGSDRSAISCKCVRFQLFRLSTCIVYQFVAYFGTKITVIISKICNE
jgi:hypothetical protein